jgi:hypothetical protein
MPKDATPQDSLWKWVRTFLVAVVLISVLALIGKELSFGGTAYFIGFVIAFVLTTLTDRENFYYHGYWPPKRDD